MTGRSQEMRVRNYNQHKEGDFELQKLTAQSFILMKGLGLLVLSHYGRPF